MYRVIKASSNLYTIEKQGRIFIARASNGYAITSGSVEDEVRRKADAKLALEGPAATISRGQSCDLDPNDYDWKVFTWLWRNAAPGSEVTMKDNKPIHRTSKGCWDSFSRLHEYMKHLHPQGFTPNIQDVKNFHFVKK